MTETIETAEPWERVKRGTLKVGWTIFGGGIVGILITRITFGTGRDGALVFGAADVVRSIALSIMLVGMAVVLLAYRLPTVAGWLQQRAETFTADQRKRIAMRAVAVVITVVVLFVLCGLVSLTTARVSMIVLSLVWLLFPAVLAAIAVYGRGYLRTFCIGAILPSLAGLIHGTQLMALMFRRITRAYYGGQSTDLLIAFVVISVAMVLSGCVCMLTRWLIEHLQGESGRPFR